MGSEVIIHFYPQITQSLTRMEGRGRETEVDAEALAESPLHRTGTGGVRHDCEPLPLRVRASYFSFSSSASALFASDAREFESPAASAS